MLLVGGSSSTCPKVLWKYMYIGYLPGVLTVCLRVTHCSWEGFAGRPFHVAGCTLFSSFLWRMCAGVSAAPWGCSAPVSLCALSAAPCDGRTCAHWNQGAAQSCSVQNRLTAHRARLEHARAMSCSAEHPSHPLWCLSLGAGCCSWGCSKTWHLTVFWKFCPLCFWPG